MIKDKLKNAHLYDRMHKNFPMVFEILQSLNLPELREGHIELDGDYVYINVSSADGRTAEEARLEAHSRYIDIQVPINEAETFGTADLSELTSPDGEPDEERDIIFYNDPIKRTITVNPDEFVIFFPNDAHAPLLECGAGHKKLVVKVSVKPNEEKPTL